MSNQVIVPLHEHQCADTATTFDPLWLMRLVSTLNLMLNGVAYFVTDEQRYIVAAMAFFVSLVGAWLTPRLAAWLWGGGCVIGFVFMAVCLGVM